MARIYAMRVDWALSLEMDWSGRVSAERLAAHARMTGEANHRRALAADLLLSRALEEYRADIPLPPKRATDENGKPYIEGLPEFHFNLSHAGDWAVCAAADNAVGVDIERVERMDMRIPRRFFAPSERARIETKADACAFWVLKESYVKALGTGLRLPLNAFQIALGEPIALCHPGEERRFHCSLIDFPDRDYRLAVCEEGVRTDNSLFLVDPASLVAQ